MHNVLTDKNFGRKYTTRSSQSKLLFPKFSQRSLLKQWNLLKLHGVEHRKRVRNFAEYNNFQTEKVWYLSFGLPVNYFGNLVHIFRV